ncbi:MAG: DUF459 domain-containing protein [Pseudomonadota bacterium]
MVHWLGDRLGAALCVGFALLLWSGLAHSQEPPEPTAPLNVAVFGDSLADGLHAGLYFALRNNPRIAEVEKLSRVSTGISNWRYVHVGEATAAQLAERQVDIAIIMFGANDIQGVVENGRVFPFRTEHWERVYRQRIRMITALLIDHGARVYWVGLPRMRSQRYDSNTVYLNAMFAEEVERLGATFIATRPLTMDAEGGYTAFGEDSGGVRRLIRADDGIHMTLRGYRMIARPVAARINAEVDQIAIRRRQRSALEAFIRTEPEFFGARRLARDVIAAGFDREDWLCRPAEPGEIEALDPFSPGGILGARGDPRRPAAG